ncbi:RDD family protein [Cellulomonas timonensis]|uniref:RDD family protein n=1 Tax=Cellulomonas timonensis TaxID=1689271 RepID=UPI000D52A608|nr:RDD family protein [Cellulomonas timonensis]
MDARQSMGSWLEGGPSSGGGAYQGARLGLPQDGPGSLAPLGRRVVALIIDWVACVAISNAFFGGHPMATLAVFAVENILLVSLLGTTLGHRLLGLRVRRVASPERLGPHPSGQEPQVDAGPAVVPGLFSGIVRSVLLCLVIPVVIWDADGRGMHDRLAGTAIVRR